MVLTVNNNRSEMIDLYNKDPKVKDDKNAKNKDAEKSTISSSSSSEGYSIMGCIAAPFVFVGNILWRCYRALFCCDFAGEGSKVDDKKADKKSEGADKAEKKAEGSDKAEQKEGSKKKEGSDNQPTKNFDDEQD